MEEMQNMCNLTKTKSDGVVANDKFDILSDDQLFVLQNAIKIANGRKYKLSNNFDILGSIKKWSDIFYGVNPLTIKIKDAIFLYGIFCDFVKHNMINCDISKDKVVELISLIQSIDNIIYGFSNTSDEFGGNYVDDKLARRFYKQCEFVNHNSINIYTNTPNANCCWCLFEISDIVDLTIQELIDMYKCWLIYLEIFNIQQNKEADNMSLKINDLINNMSNGY